MLSELVFNTLLSISVAVYGTFMFFAYYDNMPRVVMCSTLMLCTIVMCYTICVAWWYPISVFVGFLQNMELLYKTKLKTNFLIMKDYTLPMHVKSCSYRFTFVTSDN